MVEGGRVDPRRDVWRLNSMISVFRLGNVAREVAIISGEIHSESGTLRSERRTS